MERLLASLFDSYEKITEKFYKKFKYEEEQKIAIKFYNILNNRDDESEIYPINSLSRYVLSGFIYFEKYDFNKSIEQFNSALYFLEVDSSLFFLIKYKIKSIEKAMARKIKQYEIEGEEYFLSENAYVTEYDKFLKSLLFYFKTDFKKALKILKKHYKNTLDKFIDLLVYNEKIFYLNALSNATVEKALKLKFSDALKMAKNLQTYKFSIYLFYFYKKRDFLTVKKLIYFI